MIRRSTTGWSLSCILSHRVLVHAVEGYLLGCVKYPVLTAEAVLRRTTGSDGLIDLLQAEEDSMIQKFGHRGWITPSLLVKVVSMAFSRLRQGMFPNAELRCQAPPRHGIGLGGRLCQTTLLATASLSESRAMTSSGP